MAITIDKLVTLALNFHREFYPEILQKYHQSRTLSSIFPSVIGIKDRVIFTENQVGQIAQAFQKGWTPQGNLTISPEEYILRYLKVDQEISPDELRSTYLAGYLNSAQPEENEIIRKFYTAMVERAGRDTDFALIKGKFVAPTPGTAGRTVDMLDGILEVIKKFVTLSQITPKQTATITDDNAHEIIKEVWSSIPEDFRYSPDLKCYVFNGMWDKYVHSYEKTFGVMRDFVETKSRYIRNTGVEIVVLPHGGDHDMILFTMQGNITLLDNDPSDALKFLVEPHKRTLNFMMDWAGGIGFKIVGQANNPQNQYVWCNEFTGLVPTP